MALFQHNKLMYPLPEARAILGGLSAPTFYRRVKAGLIHVVKDGHRTFVTASELDRYLAAREFDHAGTKTVASSTISCGAVSGSDR